LAVDPNHQLTDRYISDGRSAGKAVGPAFTLMAVDAEADVVTR
jgi:hypothetical protein